MDWNTFVRSWKSYSLAQNLAGIGCISLPFIGVGWFIFTSISSYQNTNFVKNYDQIIERISNISGVIPNRSSNAGRNGVVLNIDVSWLKSNQDEVKISIRDNGLFNLPTYQTKDIALKISKAIRNDYASAKYFVFNIDPKNVRIDLSESDKERGQVRVNATNSVLYVE